MLIINDYYHNLACELIGQNNYSAVAKLLQFGLSAHTCKLWMTVPHLGLGPPRPDPVLRDISLLEVSVRQPRPYHTYITKLLLDHGADVHHENSDGLTALHYAVLFDPFSGYGPSGNAWATMLIHHGADANAALNPQGIPPLHPATFYNNWQAVGQLVSHGANVNAVNRYGQTAATIAYLRNVRNSHDAVLDELSMYGAQEPPPEQW